MSTPAIINTILNSLALVLMFVFIKAGSRFGKLLEHVISSINEVRDEVKRGNDESSSGHEHLQEGRFTDTP